MLGVADQYHVIDNVVEVNGFIPPMLPGSSMRKSLGTRLQPPFTECSTITGPPSQQGLTASLRTCGEILQWKFRKRSPLLLFGTAMLVFGQIITTWGAPLTSICPSFAAQTLTREESGQIFIRLCYCILSTSTANEVGVNINWYMFYIAGLPLLCLALVNNMPKKATAQLHLSLNQLTRQEIFGVLETR